MSNTTTIKVWRLDKTMLKSKHISTCTLNNWIPLNERGSEFPFEFVTDQDCNGYLGDLCYCYDGEYNADYIRNGEKAMQWLYKTEYALKDSIYVIRSCASKWGHSFHFGEVDLNGKLISKEVDLYNEDPYIDDYFIIWNGRLYLRDSVVLPIVGVDNISKLFTNIPLNRMPTIIVVSSKEEAKSLLKFVYGETKITPHCNETIVDYAMNVGVEGGNYESVLTFIDANYTLNNGIDFRMSNLKYNLVG